MKNKITALLPMKAVSERVPNKNIRQFCGKPLFYHILATLESVESIDRIIINTDSEKIKKLAKNFQKTIIHDRPLSICGNNISMNTIIDYDISNTDGEYFLQTHSTNPLLKAQTIDKAINKYFQNIQEFDSLFGVTEIKQRLYDSNKKAINHDPYKLINTQDIENFYIENSCIYIFSKSSFKYKNNRIGKNPYFFSIDRCEACDIDTEDDFKFAEIMFKTIKN